MSFCVEQLAAVKPLWSQMLQHRFLIETRDGTMSDETFAVWMKQDYLFVAAAVPFVAALLSRAPERHREPLGGVIAALQKELKLFEEQAAGVGVELKGAQPAFTNHAYIQFLMATGLGASYAEGYTVLYVAEKAYHDSWSVVKRGPIARESKWYPFVENWAGEAFAQYVGYLEGELDALAAEVGPAVQRCMAVLFALTVKYEIAFWEMAATGARWPGVKHPAP